MVPLLRFELRELLLLRETTLPICPEGYGATGEIRTHGFRVLQTLALGLSATVALFGVPTRTRT